MKRKKNNLDKLKKNLNFITYHNTIKNKIISEFEHLLKEDNYLHLILLPNIKEPITKIGDETYIFPNNESFKGRIVNGILQKGVYTWPNGQIFIGDFSPYNIFNTRGKIIFPDNKGELIGNFNFSKDKIRGGNYKIEKAIYKTQKRIYEGSFKNNKLHGQFIIQNTKNYPHYLYKGSYFEGVKHGRFILEVMSNNKKVKITGNFEKGIKNGDFKVFLLTNNDSSLNEELIYEQKFKDDYLIKTYEQKDLIESKSFIYKKVKYNIYCMEIFDYDNKLFLLLGSNKYLLIFNINITENKIYFETKIPLFKNANINDILYINDNIFLLCSSDNNFKLIQLNLEDKNNTSFNSPNKIDYNNYKLIQEFKGKPNSKNILCLIKISNDFIISGDCENIIFWKKYIEIEDESTLSTIIIDDENKGMKRSKSWIEKIIELGNFLFDKKEKINVNENKIKIKITQNEKNSFDKYVEEKCINLSSHIYCLLKIENSENGIILAAALPDSQRILFFKINGNYNYHKIKELNCSDKTKTYISKRKKIMTYINNNLFVGCINQILVINLINYEIEYRIYSEHITFINIFLDRFLICGVTKELNRLHDSEGYFVQKDLVNHSKEKKTNLLTVSEYKNFKFKGNIINSKTYHINDKNIIISIGTDNQILILK